MLFYLCLELISRIFMDLHFFLVAFFVIIVIKLCLYLIFSCFCSLLHSSFQYNEYLISDVTHQSLIGVADVSHCLLAVSVTPLLSNEQEITGKTSNTVSLSSSNDKDMSSPISCLSEDITSSDSEIGQAMKGHSSRDVEDVKKSTDYSSDSSSGSSPGYLFFIFFILLFSPLQQLTWLIFGVMCLFKQTLCHANVKASF